MKITRIEIYKSLNKLKEPFKISLGILEYAENVIIVIRTDEGITGFGECSPFRMINGESMNTCFEVGHYLADVIKKMDPLDIEACVNKMDTVIYGNSSIKSAFDIALHDIASQKAGLPLYAFLGGKNDKPMATDYTISIDNPEKMSMEAIKIKEKGFQVIKVKLGDAERDLERIKMIREAIGLDLPIRIDANQGWNYESATSILKQLSLYNIQHCEEPIPRWQFMRLPELRKNSPIAIMADESCCDHNDAQRLIDINACNSFNIKTGKSSGLYKAKKIIYLAEKANMEIQVGGFLESRLGFTASAHLALTSDNIKHFDFDTPLMFENDPTIGGISYGKNGLVHMPEKAGLGASIDEKYLKKLPKSIIE